MSSNVEGKIMKQVLSLISERDESIRQTFGAFDMNVRNAFMTFDFKVAILFKALEELGFPQERLQQIASELSNKNGMPEGGVQDDEPFNNDRPTQESVSDSRKQAEDIGEEKGSDRFG